MCESYKCCVCFAVMQYTLKCTRYVIRYYPSRKKLFRWFHPHRFPRSFVVVVFCSSIVLLKFCPPLRQRLRWLRCTGWCWCDGWFCNSSFSCRWRFWCDRWYMYCSGWCNRCHLLLSRLFLGWSSSNFLGQRIDTIFNLYRDWGLVRCRRLRRWCTRCCRRWCRRC